jgi:hypothetical protein
MSVWAAGATALGGALGGLGSSKPKKVRPMDSIPEFLRGQYESEMNGISDLRTPEYFQGQQIADQNPWLQNSLQGMAGFGQEGGMGFDAANSMMGQGNQMMGAGNQMMGQANDLMGNYGNVMDGLNKGEAYLQGQAEKGPNQFQYDQGLYDQTYNNTMGGMMGGLQDSFDNGAMALQQDFDWNQLPGFNMANAMNEGQGSTKFGQGGALMQAQTDKNKADFGNKLWMGANQNAMGMANNNAYGAGTQNLNTANTFDQNQTNNMMSNFNNQSSANMGLGNAGAGMWGQGVGAAGQGANMLGQGYDMGQNNLGLGLQAGQLQQGYDQSLIGADKAKWDYEQQAPWIAKQQKLNMMPKAGGAQAAPAGGYSPWQGAMQGGMAGLGIYGAGKDAGMWGQGSAGTSGVGELDWVTPNYGPRGY